MANSSYVIWMAIQLFQFEQAEGPTYRSRDIAKVMINAWSFYNYSSMNAWTWNESAFGVSVSIGQFKAQ